MLSIIKINCLSLVDIDTYFRENQKILAFLLLVLVIESSPNLKVMKFSLQLLNTESNKISLQFCK